MAKSGVRKDGSYYRNDETGCEDGHIDDLPVLTRIIMLVEQHNSDHPSHGADCACMDKYVRDLRKTLNYKNRDAKVVRRLSHIIHLATKHW